MSVVPQHFAARLAMNINAQVVALARAVGHRIALWLIILSACLLTASTYKVFGHTWDEPEHLAAGMQLLDRGYYSYDIQHPPIARLAMAIGPYMAGERSYGEPGPSGEQEGRDLLYRSNHYDQILTLARIGMLPFLILLLFATWSWTRTMFGEAHAIIAVVFISSTPVILGHAAVAALDVPSAATCIFALYLGMRWFDRPTWRAALAAGAAVGLAVGTKLSALPFLGLISIVWGVLRLLIERRAGDAAGTWTSYAAQMCGGSGAALLVLVFSYGFKFVYLTDSAHTANEAIDFLFSPSGSLHRFAYAVAASVPFPIGVERFILGIKALELHNLNGHLSYFMGDLQRTGWWNFYLVALGVKTPLPMLALALCGFIWQVREAFLRRHWQTAAPVAAFVAVLAFCMAYSNINIGVRHVMVLFPLLAIGAATFTVAMWRKFKARHWLDHAIRSVLMMLIAWQVSTLWSAHPDYLAYFNEIAGDHPENILIDSDLDWGQDMRRLEHVLRERHITEFSFIYRGSSDLVREDLPKFKLLWPNDRATGWIVAGLLAKATGDDGRGYTWLDAYTPVMRIGKSIDLYYIEK